MKIFWSDFALQSLNDIYIYHKLEVNKKVADSIKKKIFSATRKLIDYPKSGQIEPNLKHLDNEYRYVVSTNYKIIYREVKEGILITDIFDVRQDPHMMNNPER